MNINHNFETITEGFYKSGVIPPDEIKALCKKIPHQIYCGLAARDQ
jgi:hypothetical protein